MEFQTLYQELVNSTEMIRALLTGITQEEAQVKPGPESWSILEVICHLHDEEREEHKEAYEFKGQAGFFPEHKRTTQHNP